jgi:hypothetical protein
VRSFPKCLFSTSIVTTAGSASASPSRGSPLAPGLGCPRTAPHLRSAPSRLRHRRPPPARGCCRCGRRRRDRGCGSSPCRWIVRTSAGGARFSNSGPRNGRRTPGGLSGVTGPHLDGRGGRGRSVL